MRGFRITWLLMITRERDDEFDPDPTHHSGLMRWAIIGLAVLGVAAIIIWRLAESGRLP